MEQAQVVSWLEIVKFLFQSLIGFKINWNGLFLAQMYRKKMFQSLIGFKINWNREGLREVSHRATEFQSLIGFKINWNSNLSVMIDVSSRAK